MHGAITARAIVAGGLLFESSCRQKNCLSAITCQLLEQSSLWSIYRRSNCRRSNCQHIQSICHRTNYRRSNNRRSNCRQSIYCLCNCRRSKFRRSICCEAIVAFSGANVVGAIVTGAYVGLPIRQVQTFFGLCQRSWIVCVYVCISYPPKSPQLQI